MQSLEKGQPSDILVAETPVAYGLNVIISGLTEVLTNSETIFQQDWNPVDRDAKPQLHQPIIFQG